MAIPTITGVTPSVGAPHGRYAVVILGTNFREPTPTPFVGKEETVRVWIDGQQVPFAEVALLSDTEIEVLVPEDHTNPTGATYPRLCPVRVLNVDSAGVPIPGEDVTEPDMWTYGKMSATDTVPSTEVFRWLRKYLARNLPIPVTGTVHVDFQSDGLLTIPKEVTVPCVVLLGPRLRASPVGTQGVQDQDGSVGELRLPKCYDHEYDVMLLADNRQVLEILRTRLAEAVRVMPRTTVTWPGGSVEITGRWQDVPSKVSQADFFGAVEQAVGVLVVENVPENTDVVIGPAVLVTDVEMSFNP
jgi:hypothetical protein